MEQLVKILSAPVFHRLRSFKLYRERAFLAALPIKDTYAKHTEYFAPTSTETLQEEMLFQGAIDLLAVGDEEAWIIDYKYSRKDAKLLKKHYRPQIELYRLATSKILRLPIEKVHCSIVNISRGFQVDFD